MRTALRWAATLWVASVTSPLFAQPPALACGVTSEVARKTRSEAAADYIYDLLITCGGGIPLTGGPAPTANITVTLPVAVTSRILAAGPPPVTEALLYLNEPDPLSRFPCTSPFGCPFIVGGTIGPGSVDNKTVYQGVLTGANNVTFLGVPVLSAGSGTLKYRIGNIRAAIYQGLPATTFNAAVSATGTGFPLSPATALAAEVHPGSNFTLRDATGGTSGVPPAFSGATALNPSVGAGTLPSFFLTFAAQFFGAMANRNPAVSVANPNPTTLDPQTTFGFRQTETGYFQPSFPTVNGLNLAGLPNHGTRLSAKFVGIPAGTSLYVATQPSTFGTVGSTGIRLIDETSGGVIAPTVTISSGTTMAQLAVTGGAAAAVWEVFGPVDAEFLDTFYFPVVVSYPAGMPNATVTVQDSLAPIDTGTTAASATLPVPRYRPGPTVTAFTISSFTAPLSITTTSVPPGQEGVVYAPFTFAGSGGFTPYTWSMSAGSLPLGLALSSAGVITGTPTTPGTSSFTVRLTDSTGQSTTAAFSMSIRPRVIVTTTAVPGGVVGAAYTPFSLTATGGLLPYVFAIIGGALPPGMTMNAAGIISGTPTAVGAFAFTAEVKDSFNQAATANLSLAVSAALSITTTSVPPGQEGVAHPAFAFTGTGGTVPYTWSVSAGALPAGLTLSAAGVLSGTPTTPGVSMFTIRLADSGTQVTTASFTMTVRPRVSVTTTTVPGGNVGVAYGPFTLAATGGLVPYVWSIPAGSLPPGMGMSGAGTISGTPTAAGSFAFTTQAIDSVNQVATANLTVTVAGTVPTLSNNFSYPDGEVGRAYGPVAAQVSGGTPPYVFTLVGVLPGGLTINAGGVISGTPTASGVFTFTLTVADAGGRTAQAPYVIIVIGGLSIPTALVPSVSIGAAISTTLPVTGGCAPYRWTASGLPPGLTLSAGGVLDGQPLSDGVYFVDFTVTDCSGASARSQTSIRVAPALAVVSPSSIPDPIVGQPIPVAFAAAGGTPPYSWKVRGTLPPGVQVDGQGLLAGRPTSAGVHNFTVEATDSRSQVAERPYSMRVLSDRAADCSVAIQPGYLKFTIRQGGRSETKPVAVSALCAEALGLAAAVELPPGRSWLAAGAGVAPRPGSPALLNATANPGALPVGTYTGTIRLSGRVTGSIPVILVVAPQLSSLDVSPNGLTFTALENGPMPPAQVVNIVSQPTGSTAWTANASTTSNGQWLSINAGGGATDSGSPGVSSLLARVSTAGLPAGEYYGLIEVSSPQSSNGARLVTVALNVLPANQPLTPTPDTAGLIFTDAGTRTVTLANSSRSTLTFTISRHILDGALPWFTVEVPTNVIASGAELQVRIRPNLTGLGPGIRRGFVLIRYSDGTSTQIDIVLVIPRVSTPASTKDGTRSLAGCTPTRLAGVFTSLQQNFSVPVGWPSGVDMLIVDDCGDPLNSGASIIGFSCCDGPKPLTPLRQGRWSGTWVSRAPQNSEIQVTADFSDEPQFVKGTASISGNVARAGNPPVINDAGALSAASLSLYQPLAPGMLVSVFGTRLADDARAAQTLPLATSLGATSVSLGGRLLPLFYVSDGQVNALAPLDAPRNTELSLIVRRGAALSAPAVVTLAPAAAGAFTLDQQGVGQAAVVDQQGRLVNPANGAARGALVSLFATGLGPVDREVAAGAPAPDTEPLARTTEPVEVTVGEARALVLYSGLAPGFVGLYQVNFLIPADAPVGDTVALVVRAGESTSSRTAITVR